MKSVSFVYRLFTIVALFALLFLSLSPASASPPRRPADQGSGVFPDPPAVVADLVANTGALAGEVDLSWIAPGVDGTAGTASVYIVRYNTTPIIESNWDASNDVTGESTPNPAGSVENMTVSGLLPGQTYYFAIKTQDEAPNTSGVSNSPRAIAQLSNAIYLPLIVSSGSGAPPIISGTTKVLTDTTTQYLSSISSDGAVFTFTQSTPALDALAPGEVIVGDATANAPYGFLRKVTSVSSAGGQVIVETEGAVLEEAIESGAAQVSRLLTPDQIEKSTQLQGVSLATVSRAQNGLYFLYTLDEVVLYDEDGDLNTTDDQITADGSIRLEPSFDFSLEVEDFQLETLSFTASAEETAILEIKTEVESTFIKKEKEIARHTFNPITVQIGPLPVVIVPVLTVNVGVDGSVHIGITTGVTQQATLMAGLQYADDTWSPVSEFSNHFYYNPPTLSAGLDLKGYAGAQLSLLIYGVTGPYAEVNAYLKLEADVLAEPWWILYGGLEAPVGVENEIFSHLIAGYEATIIDYRLMLAQARANSPPNLPSAPSPANGATNQPITTTLSWTGGDLDGDAVTYDVYFEAGDTTPDVLVSDDQSGATYDPGTLASDLHYYWRIVAQDEHGATMGGPVWAFSTGEMVSIPAGEFQMGCDANTDSTNCNYYSWQDQELPLHTVYLDAYNIDKYEVTNAQYRACADAGVCAASANNSSSTRPDYFTNSAYDNYPVIYVSWYNANDYCAWVGKRLPTEAEWEKAARGGSDTRPYPWGSVAPNCPLSNYKHYNGSSYEYCVGDTSEVGSYPAGASPYGALDMAGNVWEWVNDWYDGNYYSVSPGSNPPGPTSGTYKVIRGGGWTSGWNHVRAPYRDRYGLGNSYNGLGFRCAVSPGQ